MEKGRVGGYRNFRRSGEKWLGLPFKISQVIESLDIGGGVNETQDVR